MKSPIIAFFLVLFTRTFILATPVDSAKAAQLAYSFFVNMRGDEQKQQPDMKVSQYFDITTGEIVLYVFTDKANSDFLIVSGDDATQPILGYSNAHNAIGAMPPALDDLINSYIHQISLIKINGLKQTPEIANSWKQWEDSYTKKSDTKAIADPLLICTWNQGAGYNALCPQDPAGPGGRVYAGCVATAMAMAMYYYRYPEQGTGTHGYQSDYGYLSVDFSQSQYHFNAMPTYNGSNPSYDIAKLQYDCGVAVNMMYSPSGSGAYMEDAAEAMRSHFKYNTGLSLEYRDSYTESEWIGLLKAQIDLGYPMPYAGYDNNAGHAFICDGYDSGDYFHFNWGWGGAYNGFFYINNLNPGYDFNWGHQAIINAYPSTQSYPKSCENDVITENSGSIVVGITKGNYLNNQNCQWQISPQDSISSIRFSFQYLNTELTNDIIKIYQGIDANGILVGTYSGNTLPSTIQVEGNNAFVTFSSNSNITNKGFVLDFFANEAIYCNSLTNLSDTNGLISDGSGSYQYHSDALCRWRINTPGAQGYTIDFSQLDLEENVDFVKIYEVAASGLIEKAAYTGSNIPNQTYFPYASIMVFFRSNNIIEKDGFCLEYHSLLTGIDESIQTETPFAINSGEAPHHLIIGDIEEGSYSVIITDINGKVVFSEVLALTKFSNSAPLSLSTLKSGVYFAKISKTDYSCVIKFVATK